MGLKTWRALSCSVALLVSASACHPRGRPAGSEGDAPTQSSSASEHGGPIASRTLAQRDFGCGLPEELRARGWPTMLAGLRPGEPPPPAPGGFTIVVLPDTQYYVACRSDHLARQVRYVLERQEQQNVLLVLTVGDLTDHNDAAEWAFFRDAVAPLFDRVPLILTTGNHDHGPQGEARSRGSGLLSTFGEPPVRSRELLAASAEGNWENAYYRLPLGKSTLGILTLEWSPRRSAVAWAGRVLDQYPGDRLIFSTHAYLYHDDRRYDWERFGPAQEWNPRSYGTARLDLERAPGPENWNPEGAYDGEMLWQGLLASRPGLFLTVNGHVLGDGEGYLATRAPGGNLVHQMLMNFQMLEQGGSGFLRLLQVDPGGDSMRIFTYSPSLDRSATRPREQFQVELSPPLEF